MTSLFVLQSTAWYIPYDVGGTEIYLEGLVEGLFRLGIQSLVLVPRTANAPESYLHRGARIETYPPRALAGEANHLEGLEARLRANPDAIYHQHSWTPDCGVEELELARRLGHRTVLTIHVPANICLRGNMMLFGERACDGKVLVGRCGACWAHGRGASRSAAEALARLPNLVGDMASKRGGSSGRLVTALRARAIARDRQRDIARMVSAADRVVAVCQWLHDALVLNGVPPEKLVLSRQGAGHDFLDAVARAPAAAVAGPECTDPAPLRLLFLGRWHPVKGIDIVVQAIRALPGAAVELTIHGVGDGDEERAYRAAVEALIDGDRRIVIRPPLPREDIPAAMMQFDAMVVPSNWLETGPLVVLEAQAAGLYIVGSDLGGIAELVNSPDKGRLVADNDMKAWSTVIQDLVRQRPRGVRQPVRTMDDAAGEMAALYRTLD